MHLWLPPEDPVSSCKSEIVGKSDEKQTDSHLEHQSLDVFEQICNFRWIVQLQQSLDFLSTT